MENVEKKESSSSSSFKENLNEELDRRERESSTITLKEIWGRLVLPTLVLFFILVVISILLSNFGPSRISGGENGSERKEGQSESDDIEGRKEKESSKESSPDKQRPLGKFSNDLLNKTDLQSPTGWKGDHESFVVNSSSGELESEEEQKRTLEEIEPNPFDDGGNDREWTDRFGENNDPQSSK